METNNAINKSPAVQAGALGDASHTNQTEQETWKWYARADRIYGGEIPKAWLGKMPSAEEVAAVYRFLLQGMSRQLLSAVMESDKQRGGESFADTYPEVIQKLVSDAK
jgi:hypothetical protein